MINVGAKHIRIRKPSDAKRYRRQDLSSAKDREVRPEQIEGAAYPERFYFQDARQSLYGLKPETVGVVAE
jgi:hypothetical protein